ncbi:class I SAM-dependent methyltransferase [Micromonospora sp. WMMD812]|uniref:class I SAM-dependent methyltransferase n=1 Tax=Micromonospora sp. WMMD812 TaxID=3015152 RepID=UPI00248B2903|nr:class I SAM-dependent methyltransferase [Micromonospora sp. WMMD812]WBB70857.1 class I SAM-dependent methyltransferase [Micromonospora sp. WMMD812]
MVFGEVAHVYDDVRPGYPTEIARTILDYHGTAPAHVVEIGAGTGKGTDVLLRLGAPITCLEPDPRMAARLTAKHPQVQVRTESFEQWRPPAGGVPLIAAALAWHWLDPATRNPRAHAALTPGGTLAAFGHRYAYADPDQAAAIDATLRAIDPTVRDRPPTWLHDDIIASGLFTDVRTETTSRHLPLTTDRYQQLIGTFGPFRTRPVDERARALDAVRALVDGFGGTVVLDLRTTLVLARRPGTA